MPSRACASRTFARLLEERDDGAQWSARSAGRFDPRSLQFRHVLLGDDAASDDDDVPGPPLLQEADDLGEQRHVSAAQGGEPDRIDVLLNRGLDDVLWGLP